MAEAARMPDEASRWYHPIALVRGLWARPKLILAIATAMATLVTLHLAAPGSFVGSARLAVAWNAGAVVYLGIAFAIMASCGVDRIREKAEEEDESRFVFLIVVLMAIAASFTAVIALIGEAKVVTGGPRAIYLALAGATILTSWLVMQVVFTLHYAHDYYRPQSADGGPSGGLLFPHEEEPDYWDFLYFTTSIGAASQTSDVSVASKPLRRLVTAQSVLAFIFNTTILALAINVASGLIGGN